MKPSWRALVALSSAAIAAAAVGWLALRPSPAVVDTATVSRGLFVQTVLNEGRTRVRDRYAVSAPIAGMLARVALRIGDPVDPSTVLAAIAPGATPLDDERTRLQLRERLGVAQAARNRAIAAAGRASAKRDQARSDLARTSALVSKGAATVARQEQDELALKLAERELQVAEFDAHLAEHEEALARVALDRDGERTAAGAVEIKSPIAGVVLKIVQQSEGPIALGAPIMEIGDPAQLEIIADLLTTDAVRVRPGSAASAVRWGGADPLAARVSRVEPAAFTKISALGIDEQRVLAILDIVAPREQWSALGDGFRVEARIEVAREASALVAPLAALFRENADWKVFLVEDGRARKRKVAIGLRSEAEAIIAEGLTEGDKVVLFPPPALRDGTPVAPRARDR